MDGTDGRNDEMEKLKQKALVINELDNHETIAAVSDFVFYITFLFRRLKRPKNWKDRMKWDLKAAPTPHQHQRRPLLSNTMV